MEQEIKYVTPTVRVIAMNSTRVLCGSEGQDAIWGTEMQEGNDNW